jgi:hypothetical protein
VGKPFAAKPLNGTSTRKSTNQSALKVKHFESLETEKSTKTQNQKKQKIGYAPKRGLRALYLFLLGLYTFNHWRLDLLENSVAADYAFGFSASKFQLLRGHSGATTHALVYNS